MMIILSTLTTAQSKQSQSDSNKLDKIIGTWVIDLRPDPDSDNYFKDFVIDSVEAKSFSGKFYDTNFSNGYLNSKWGNKIYFAFSTKDASNTYFHSGYIEDEKIFGISYSPERKFTMPWFGEKIK